MYIYIQYTYYRYREYVHIFSARLYILRAVWLTKHQSLQLRRIRLFLFSHFSPPIGNPFISLLPLKLLLSKLHWFTHLGDVRNAAATGTLTSTIVKKAARLPTGRPWWYSGSSWNVGASADFVQTSSFLQVETSQSFNQVTLSRVNLSERSSRIFRHIASYFRAFFLSHF